MSGRVLLVRSAAGGPGAVGAATVAALRGRGWEVGEMPLEPDGVPARTARRALRLARSELEAADVVHAELGLLDGAVFWFALGASRSRPVVLVAHDAPRVVHSPGASLIRTGTRVRDIAAYRLLAPLLDRPLVRRLDRRVAAAVVLSGTARDGWRGPACVLVSDHPADPPTPAAPPPSQGRHVLFAGYLTRGKGIEALLEAWRGLDGRDGPPLVIAGEAHDPRYGRELRLLAGELPRPPVWLGRVEDAELTRLVAEAAVVVVPYLRSNPASGILVRALVEGRAVVATRVPAALDTVRDGEDGLLVPPGDTAALLQALAGALADPGLRDRLGARAAARAAERFTWPRHLDVLERAYDLARGRA